MSAFENIDLYLEKDYVDEKVFNIEKIINAMKKDFLFQYKDYDEFTIYSYIDFVDRTYYYILRKLGINRDSELFNGIYNAWNKEIKKFKNAPPDVHTHVDLYFANGNKKIDVEKLLECMKKDFLLQYENSEKYRYAYYERYPEVIFDYIKKKYKINKPRNLSHRLFTSWNLRFAARHYEYMQDVVNALVHEQPISQKWYRWFDPFSL